MALASTGSDPDGKSPASPPTSSQDHEPECSRSGQARDSALSRSTSTHASCTSEMTPGTASPAPSWTLEPPRSGAVPPRPGGNSDPQWPPLSSSMLDSWPPRGKRVTTRPSSMVCSRLVRSEVAVGRARGEEDGVLGFRSGMMDPWRRSKTFRMAAAILVHRSSDPVPKVSTWMDTGSATPMALGQLDLPPASGHPGGHQVHRRPTGLHRAADRVPTLVASFPVCSPRPLVVRVAAVCVPPMIFRPVSLRRRVGSADDEASGGRCCGTPSFPGSKYSPPPGLGGPHAPGSARWILLLLHLGRMLGVSPPPCWTRTGRFPLVLQRHLGLSRSGRIQGTSPERRASARRRVRRWGDRGFGTGMNTGSRPMRSEHSSPWSLGAGLRCPPP